MRHELRFNVFDRESFLKEYSKVLELKLNSDILQKLCSPILSKGEVNQETLDKLSEIGLIRKRDETSYDNGIVVLTIKKSLIIKEMLNDKIDYIVKELKSSKLLKVKDSVTFNNMLFVVLGYLWQELLSRNIMSSSSGSIVLIENMENSPSITFDNLGNGRGDLIVWANTSQQKNNNHLNIAMNNKHVIKMIHSINNEGVMIPYGESHEKLKNIRITKLVSDKHCPKDNNVLNQAYITKDLVVKNRDNLKEITKLGLLVVKEVSLVASQAYNRFVDSDSFDNQSSMTQMVYYIFCHVIIQKMIKKGVLKDWAPVPYLK